MIRYVYKKEGYLVLGINGWIERKHDASAALIEVTKSTCRILGALEEEKVIGIKRAYNMFPKKSVECLLYMFGLSPEDIDEIAIGWDYPKFYKITNRDYPFISNDSMLDKIFGKKVHKDIPINFIGHHLAHAACSFRTSNFREDALTFVIDGQGEDISISVWKSQNDELVKLYTQPICNSLGYMYEAVNYMLGFETYESGKTMGLAAYGEPKYLSEISSCFKGDELSHKMKVYMRIFDNYSIDTIDSSPTMITMWRYFYENDLKIQRNEHLIKSFYDVPCEYMNLAASVQKYLENTVINLIRKYTKETGLSNVCLSGGVALNCKMNGEIIAEECVDKLFINPAANDGGVSLGAALELAHQRGYCSDSNEEFSPYLGIEFADSEIIDYLKEKGVSYKLVDTASDFIAKGLENNDIIALFQGRNEWGPRALGNRSIIANSKIHGNLDHINQYVKDRELGRPLSPSLIDDDIDYFSDSHKAIGRYMNIASYAQYNIDKNPAVVHVDKTYRPGFVSKEFNTKYYNQLKSIHNLLGESAVINTSFNLKTPIICCLGDALDFLYNRDIKSLVFNDSIIVIK